MVWRFYPVGPEETYEIFDFFFETDSPNDAEREAIKFVDETLQPEDIALVESVQRGMRTPAFNQGRYLSGSARSSTQNVTCNRSHVAGSRIIAH